MDLGRFKNFGVFHMKKFLIPDFDSRAAPHYIPMYLGTLKICSFSSSAQGFAHPVMCSEHTGRVTLCLSSKSYHIQPTCLYWILTKREIKQLSLGLKLLVIHPGTGVSLSNLTTLQWFLTCQCDIHEFTLGASSTGFELVSSRLEGLFPCMHLSFFSLGFNPFVHTVVSYLAGCSY